MNPSIFVSVSTEPGIPSAERVTIRYDQFVAKLLKPLPEAMNAAHIAMGLAGELGELYEENCDAVEELGDYEFYLQAALNHYGLTLQECIDASTDMIVKDLVTLTGELIDCIKREYVYNKPRELARIKSIIESIEDELKFKYYVLKTTRQQVLQLNAQKLEKRYAGLYYSDEAAQVRADKA